MMEQLENYILKHISPEPPYLARLYHDTHVRHLYPRMCSGHLQGRILKMLVGMIRPSKVLELGTFTGYSALCIAEGMPDGGELHTIEINDEMEDELTELFSSSPGGEKITLHIGDAASLIPTLGDGWDLVYIDANKRDYTAYYELIMPRLKIGAYIIADNTLWDGKVIAPEDNHDAQSLGIMRFNDMIAEDRRVEKVILPLRDGLTVIRKISE